MIIRPFNAAYLLLLAKEFRNPVGHGKVKNIRIRGNFFSGVKIDARARFDL